MNLKFCFCHGRKYSTQNTDWNKKYKCVSISTFQSLEKNKKKTVVAYTGR